MKDKLEFLQSKGNYKKKKLRNDTYLLEFSDGTKQIYKENRIKDGFSGLIKKLFIKGSVSYINELSFYRYISGNENYNYFKFPQFHYGNNKYLVIGYIDGKLGLDDNVEPQVITRTMLEFQVNNRNFKKKMENKLINYVTRKYIFRIPRSIYRIFIKTKNWRLVKDSLILLFTLSKTEKKQKLDYLLHNDIMNIFTNREGYILLFDFETIQFERKWILTDIIELCLDFDTLDFDFKLFQLYCEELKIREKIKFDECSQLRFGLFRVILLIIESKSKREYNYSSCKYYHFLISNIFSDSGFKEWYFRDIS
ncbi:hypothetical protein [Evansella halocellulosilytica]|uniref:hypothetical protein n=1 Tax=Evansella halocellulosilytica TaxID=2011013 RepID=UPI000BB6A214|nr:hypothetical protein [Evansella halocellulosilytica]